MSYPPHIARRRRELGLPVTPEEHAAYKRGESRDPPVTREQMARTLRDVAPRCAPRLRAVFLELAAKMERRERLTDVDLQPAGGMGVVIRNVQAREDREPGDDG